MWSILLVFYFDTLLQVSKAQSVEYAPANFNPPHGCSNFGLCVDPSFTVLNETNALIVKYTGCPSDNCVCVTGTMNGTRACAEIIDQCDPWPCDKAGHFECSTGINSHKCTCAPGYTGKKCDIEIDSVCASHPCKNDGTCVSNEDDASSYTCQCKPPYFGTNCETRNECLWMNCNNGNCELALNNSTFYCNCNEGFEGRYCEKSTIQRPPAEYVGCYRWEDSLWLNQERINEAIMTVEKCNDYANFLDPFREFITFCGGWCFASHYLLLNDTTNSGNDCKQKCMGNQNQICGKFGQKCILYEAGEYTDDPNACLNETLCGASNGFGICINKLEIDGGYECVCSPFRTGSDCEIEKPLACAEGSCNNHTCILDPQYNKYSCECSDGYTGYDCQHPPLCNETMCQNGGTCKENDYGGYSCLCLSFYSGNNCENIDRCQYNNPCINGFCNNAGTGISANQTCSCFNGWNETFCDTMINYCDDEPCKYNSTCTPFFQGYNCTCPPGLEGNNCDIIIDQCAGYTKDGVYFKSPCNTKDENAVCQTGINTFNCTCSSKWTDTLCDLNVLIKDVLMAIYGYVDLNMISLLNDLMLNPSQIKDMVPFITGLLTQNQRSDLSWSVDDLFHWIAFEDKKLNLHNDIVQWNDVVLGNCFSFNYRDQNFTYKMRSSGRHGGILALMKANQGEYAPWYDTAAVNVFIHYRNEYIFSESVRYNAEPNSQTTLNIYNTRYTRLGGLYGKCINKISEVKNYYYPGAYTTDGCLRTCYQDMIMSVCSCMDPRYPQAFNSTSCQLSERSCVTDASESAGDPSTWKSCVCPLPCSNQQFSVTWSKADFVEDPVECNFATDKNECKNDYKDNVMISILLPKLDFKIYAETPAMDFNKFLSQLGGQLGVLMGINLVSFIEIFFLLIGIILICCRKYKK